MSKELIDAGWFIITCFGAGIIIAWGFKWAMINFFKGMNLTIVMQKPTKYKESDD
jgi:hypothetical protein